jgi:hypothetical protein
MICGGKGNWYTLGPINKNAPQHRDSASTMMVDSITALRISRKIVVKWQQSLIFFNKPEMHLNFRKTFSDEELNWKKGFAS